MAEFLPAYKNWVEPIEGGYGWFAADSGGETYAGIARNYNPQWEGWPIIDQIKRTRYANVPIPKGELSPIKNNTKFPELKAMVLKFYQGLWDKNLFGQIKTQPTAEIIFDWFVNSGNLSVRTQPKETYGVDELLREKFGQNIPDDGRYDVTTIKAINAVNQAQFYEAVRQARIDFYKYLYSKNPTRYEQFINGWMNRIKAFPTSIKVAVGGSAVIAIIIIAGLIIRANQ